VGKLKVNIKANASKPSNPAPPVAPVATEINLLGEAEPDLFSAPAAAPAGAAAAFDPFGTTPVQETAQVSSSFDPFGMAPAAPAQPEQQAFDPFSNSAPAQQHQQQFAQFNQPPPAMPISMPPVPPQQQQQQAFSQAPAEHQGMFNSMQAPTQQMAMQPMIKIQAPVAEASADFGDFEEASSEPTASAKADSAIQNKWGDLSNLVDLGGIGKNEEKKTGRTQCSRNVLPTEFICRARRVQ